VKVWWGGTMMDTRSRQFRRESACAWMWSSGKKTVALVKEVRGLRVCIRRPWPKARPVCKYSAHLGNWEVVSTLVLSQQVLAVTSIVAEAQGRGRVAGNVQRAFSARNRVGPPSTREGIIRVSVKAQGVGAVGIRADPSQGTKAAVREPFWAAKHGPGCGQSGLTGRAGRVRTYARNNRGFKVKGSGAEAATVGDEERASMSQHTSRRAALA